MVILLIIIFFIIILIDLPIILNIDQKLKKTIVIYIILIGIGFTISLLQVINQAPTSPAVVIENVIKNIVSYI